MIKLTQPDAHPALLESNQGVSATCITDFSERLVKSASNNTITEDILRECRPDKDHMLVHLIALGDEEQYGWNRNNDGFPKQANIQYHPTFLSHANVYREHANKDPQKRIGIVKAAKYNAPMSRVELAIWLNKEAAAPEFEMVKQGKALSWSMACKIAKDQCSCCGHEASSPLQYCDHLRETPGQWVPEFNKFAYAHNHTPVFFDISRVANPADRIAHYLSYQLPDSLEKAAGVQRVLGGAELAEAYGLKEAAGAQYSIPTLYHLRKLAAMEQDAKKEPAVQELLKVGSAMFAVDPLPQEAIDGLRRMQPATVFRKLAKLCVPLPFNEFCRYINGVTQQELDASPQYKQACAMLPGMFSNLMVNPEPESLCDSVFGMGPPVLAAQETGDDMDRFFSMLDEKYGVRKECRSPKMIRITVIHKKASATEVKTEAPSDLTYHNLARAYGMYKLAFLKDVESLHGTGYVDDTLYGFILSQNEL